MENPSNAMAARLSCSGLSSRQSITGMFPIVVMVRLARPCCCRFDMYHRAIKPRVLFIHKTRVFSHGASSSGLAGVTPKEGHALPPIAGWGVRQAPSAWDVRRKSRLM